MQVRQLDRFYWAGPTPVIVLILTRDSKGRSLALLVVIIHLPRNPVDVFAAQTIILCSTTLREFNRLTRGMELISNTIGRGLRLAN